MAVIQIPSKNIFSIDNPKIIDNIIDKIEINTNNTKIIVDKDGLSYTETVGTPMNIVGNYYEIADAQNYSINRKSSDESIVSIIEGSNARNATFQLLLYTEMRLGYLTIPIKIYKNTYSDKYITDIYYGVDQENQPRIEYTSLYNEAEIPTTGQWRYQDTSQKYPSANDSVTFTIGSPSSARQTNGKILLDNLTDNTDNQVTQSENTINYHYKITPSFRPSGATTSVNLSAENNISLEDKTRVTQSRFTKGKDEQGDYFYIELTILCSRQITTLINPDYEMPYYTRGSIPNPHTLSGSSYIDVTSNVSFTFHGETIQLDVGELLKYVGKENGTNVFSVDTNELVQQSNTPLLEKYEKILEAYKDGKETATILCSIDNYYTAKKDKAISIEPNSIAFSENVGGTATGALLFSASGSFFIGIGKIRNLQIKTLVGETSTVSYNELTGEISWRIRGTRNQKVSAIVTGIIELPSGLPMYFHLRDKVIPYIYSANGVDVPMSQYKNGTPKVFEVLSSKIYYDGAVWQELVLVESKE